MAQPAPHGSSELPSSADAAPASSLGGVSSDLNSRFANEDYLIWKKNSPYLYDLLVSHAFEWPSLTVQWFPDKSQPDGKDYSVQRLLCGTHTGDSQNCLLIFEARLPSVDEELMEQHAQAQDGDAAADADSAMGGYGSGRCGRVDLVQSIPHGAEVNRARYSPHNPNLIATRQGAGEGAVLLFDRTKHQSKPSEFVVRADLELVGHKDEGYGLHWNAAVEGELITCGNDHVICRWNIGHGSKDVRSISPLSVYKGHRGVVEDVEFHAQHAHVFASVGDDQAIMMWDTRKEPKAIQTVEMAHAKEINTLSFNPHSDFLMATGGADRVVKIWDMRNFSAPVHALTGHQDEIFSCQWAPFSIDVIASSGADRRVFVWDLSRVGSALDEADQADGPPELAFIHGGHTDRVSDFAWNPNADEEWTIASVADDNIIQIWKMADNGQLGKSKLAEINQGRYNNSNSSVKSAKQLK